MHNRAVHRTTACTKVLCMSKLANVSKIRAPGRVHNQTVHRNTRRAHITTRIIADDQKMCPRRSEHTKTCGNNHPAFPLSGAHHATVNVSSPLIVVESIARCKCVIGCKWRKTDQYKSAENATGILAAVPSATAIVPLRDTATALRWVPLSTAVLTATRRNSGSSRSARLRPRGCGNRSGVGCPTRRNNMALSSASAMVSRHRDIHTCNCTHTSMPAKMATNNWPCNCHCADATAT